MSAKIIYQDPKHFLLIDQMHEYHDKIRIFKYFEPTVFISGNSYSVEYELNNYKTMSETEYKEYLSQLNNKKTVYIGTKSPCTNTKSYMYNFKEEDTKNLDSLDKEFIEKQEGRMELYGLHTYGGYYGFFRPDFYETIHLLNTKISLDELKDIKRIYLTTSPHPNDNIGFCYDSKKDKHRAKTTCYIYYSDGQTNRKKIKLSSNLDETRIKN